MATLRMNLHRTNRCLLPNTHCQTISLAAQSRVKNTIIVFHANTIFAVVKIYTYTLYFFHNIILQSSLNRLTID